MIHTSLKPEEISLIYRYTEQCTIDYTLCHTPAPLVGNDVTSIYTLLSYNNDLNPN